MAREVDVRLLYFDGCPGWRIAETRVREALTAVGADPKSMTCERITTAEQPEAIGFRGSPTILIDGHDPFGHACAPGGLACRIYRSPNGERQAAPAPEELRAALTRAIVARSTRAGVTGSGRSASGW